MIRFIAKQAPFWPRIYVNQFYFMAKPFATIRPPCQPVAPKALSHSSSEGTLISNFFEPRPTRHSGGHSDTKEHKVSVKLSALCASVVQKRNLHVAVRPTAPLWIVHIALAAFGASFLSVRPKTRARL
jgi:hypothetical protein